MTGRVIVRGKTIKNMKSQEVMEMARPPSKETKRDRTQESIVNALRKNDLTENFIADKVEEYMSFYDDLLYINDALTDMKSSGYEDIKKYTEATGEKRRISGEMRKILEFLGLKPTVVPLPMGGGSDEEL